MAKTSFELKIDIPLQKLLEIDAKVEERAEEGLGRALLQLKRDTVMQRPTVPIREGFLRGSSSIHVQSREIPVPLGPEERSDKKIQGYKIPLEPHKIIGLVGFNVPYASRCHEVPMNFTDPEAGNKYLESKMANNKMLYKQIIVTAIHEEAKKQ